MIGSWRPESRRREARGGGRVTQLAFVGTRCTVNSLGVL